VRGSVQDWVRGARAERRHTRTASEPFRSNERGAQIDKQQGRDQGGDVDHDGGSSDLRTALGEGQAQKDADPPKDEQSWKPNFKIHDTPPGRTSDAICPVTPALSPAACCVARELRC
jgi:hypothetical protein